MNGFSAADMSTAAANGRRDALGAAQEAVAWSKTKPTAEGAYYVRGFNLFQIAQYEALVQVRMHHFDGETEPELVCNIHESTSNADMDDWSPIVEMSEDFEWLGPLYAAPVAAAPVVPVDIANARRLYHHFANGGTLTKGDVSRLVQAIEVRDTQSPAAPGIDLRNAILQLQEDALHMKDPGDTVNAYNRVLALIDASTKDGSDATAFYDASAKGFHISETCGPDGKYHAVSKFQTLADLHAFEDARRTLLIAERDRRELQATSAEVGS